MEAVSHTLMTLEHLPIVGRNVIVFMKSGSCRVPEARIMSDKKHLHINAIGRSSWREFPFISGTTELPLSEVLNIAYEDEHGDRYVLLPV